ncbi:hypothetical protein AVEN_71170-1 [Araneus ventricosus]|uniref:Uncharacterized protein n=1 Tax=Araneus ventricosus TaxID=182803 RepID=A0A4Y2SL85_ARAVE|nr:hypothetical protein AVEN_71170-1 [Araneus ventricosus]
MSRIHFSAVRIPAGHLLPKCVVPKSNAVIIHGDVALNVEDDGRFFQKPTLPAEVEHIALSCDRLIEIGENTPQARTGP